MRIWLVSIVVLGASIACKPKAGSQEGTLKTSGEVAEAMNAFQQLELTERQAICENVTLFVYVGNADSMGTLEFSPGIQKNPEIVRRISDERAYLESTFFQVVKTAGEEFRRALSNPHRCPPSAKTAVSLLRIIDGPGINDSSITLNAFAFEDGWRELSERRFQYVQGKLAEQREPKAFELNMPAALQHIVQGVRENLGGSQAFSQISYFIKSHGGIASVQRQKAPDLYSYVGDSLKAKIDARNKKHVMLFDAHGENGEILKSHAFGYYWTKENACKLFAAKNLTDQLEAANCRDSLALCLRETGDISYCKALYREPDGRAPSSQGDGNPTQGDGNPTQGDGNPTQGDGNPTQGDGNPTQGDGNPTQGAELLSQGPGKELMFFTDFVDRPDLNRTTNPDASRPDIIKHMGAMASYDVNSEASGEWVTNIVNLSLPVGSKLSAPMLMVLDSCYGSDQIFNAANTSVLEKAKTILRLFSPFRRDQSGMLSVVTLSNPKPTYYYTINYRKLDTVGYLALPYILAWDRLGAPGSVDQVPALAHSLRRALLQPSPEVVAEVSQRYRDEVKIEMNKINEQWLELKPEVHVIEIK